MSPQDPSQPEFSQPSGDQANRNRAEDNLARCLEALNKEGEVGLQRELDRLYPGTSAEPQFLISHHTEDQSPSVEFQARPSETKR